jgi:hypothetical protein
VQEHLHHSRALLDRDLFYLVLEPEFLDRPQKDGGFVAAGICEDRLSAGSEEPGNQLGEGRGVLAFVEHIRCENEVERSQIFDVRRAPVEEGRVGFLVQVGAGVVGGEVEGGLVMVCGEYHRAAGEGDEGGQPDAAPEFDGPRAGEVEFREVAGQGEGARP